MRLKFPTHFHAQYYVNKMIKQQIILQALCDTSIARTTVSKGFIRMPSKFNAGYVYSPNRRKKKSEAAEFKEWV